MRIIDSEGELRTFSLNDDPAMFHAVQTNLGLFGVIYDMTFELFDRTIVKEENDFHHRVKDIFYNEEYLKKLVLENDSVEVFWMPFNGLSWLEEVWEFSEGKLTRDEWDPKQDETWVKRVNILKKGKYDESDINSECHYSFLNIITWLESKGVNVIDKFVVKYPARLTPLSTKASFAYLKNSYHKTYTKRLPHAIHYRPNIDQLSVHDMEFCFNVNDDFSVVTKACQAVINIVQDTAEQGEFPLNVTMEMRWMADSEAYLCPAYIGNKSNGGSGHTFYIEVLSYTHTAGWQEFCDRVADEWNKLGGTIHWAKEWHMLDEGDELMKKIYKKPAELFVEQLDKSGVDPTGVFVNDTLRHILLDDRKYPVYVDPNEKKHQETTEETSD